MVYSTQRSPGDFHWVTNRWSITCSVQLSGFSSQQLSFEVYVNNCYAAVWFSDLDWPENELRCVFNLNDVKLRKKMLNVSAPWYLGEIIDISSTDYVGIFTPSKSRLNWIDFAVFCFFSWYWWNVCDLEPRSSWSPYLSLSLVVTHSVVSSWQRFFRSPVALVFLISCSTKTELSATFLFLTNRMCDIYSTLLNLARYHDMH